MPRHSEKVFPCGACVFACALSSENVSASLSLINPEIPEKSQSECSASQAPRLCIKPCTLGQLLRLNSPRSLSPSRIASRQLQPPSRNSRSNRILKRLRRAAKLQLPGAPLLPREVCEWLLPSSNQTSIRNRLN